MAGFRLLKLYQRALKSNPYIVQSVQTGSLMAAGDFISQHIIEKKDLSDIDFKRTLKFSSLGFFVYGPVLFKWYSILDRSFGSGGKTVVVKKVLADQLLAAPFLLLGFLVMFGTLQGKSTKTIKHDVENKYIDILKTNYTIWPVVQLCNFYYVPLQYQVLTVQMVALLWNVYLSWKSNNE